ncbi:hypothetical protein Trydic_g18131 [Trypoxylus dichotomus]
MLHYSLVKNCADRVSNLSGEKFLKYSLNADKLVELSVTKFRGQPRLNSSKLWNRPKCLPESRTSSRPTNLGRASRYTFVLKKKVYKVLKM